MASQPPALILAAGRGERMRPLTDTCPKPLLLVHGKPLIEWHLEALARAGVRQVVINTAWLEEQFPAALGDGSRWGLAVRYSTEGRDHGGALETAGGIAKALPWLAPDDQHDTFWVVSGDVFLPDFTFNATDAARFAASRERAHLWLAANAPHYPQGDFGIDAANGLATANEPRRTWASVGLFRADMFAGIAPGTHRKLRPLLDAALAAGRLGAQTWDGSWTDVGTIERLQALNDATQEPVGRTGAAQSERLPEDPMATVRYLVDDVDAALPFYAALGFALAERWGPPFAIVEREGLTLWLSGPGSSAAKPLADGRVPQPGGWNRLVIEVDDLDAMLATLQAGGARFRGAPIQGPGGRQVLVDDPSGNPVELFEARGT